MRLLIRTTMVAVALAAAALSFQSLMHLGELCGYGRLSWAYPLTLDLAAAGCCAEWLHSRKRQALWLTWAFIAVSILLNGTVHYLTSTGTPPHWLLVVLVAAVPPGTFGLICHLGWSGQGVQSDAPLHKPGQPDGVVSTHTEADLGTTETRSEALQDLHPLPPERTDDELLVAVEAIADRDGKRPSRNKVTSELGIGATRATRLLEQFDQTGPRRTA